MYVFNYVFKNTIIVARVCTALQEEQSWLFAVCIACRRWTNMIHRGPGFASLGFTARERSVPCWHLQKSISGIRSQAWDNHSMKLDLDHFTLVSVSKKPSQWSNSFTCIYKCTFTNLYIFYKYTNKLDTILTICFCFYLNHYPTNLPSPNPNTPFQPFLC